MMKQSIFTQFVLVLAVSTAAAGARAEGRLSVGTWTQEFAKAAKAGDTKKIQQLADFSALDKKITACDDCDNKSKMTSARKLYAQGKYEEARALYSEIDKKSPYWLEAVEEKAWTFFRQNQLDESLAQAKTLLSPQFSGFVGSEAYFLQALAQLKSCNYQGVFETNRLFKDKQKSRLVEIQNLTKSGMNASLQTLMTSAENFPMSFSDVGETATALPKLFYKDIQFQKQLMRFRLADQAIKALDASENGANLKGAFEKAKASSLALLQKRVKELASQETNDNFKIVQKLNLVEVESIQRLHNDVELDKKLFKRADFNKTNSDQLVFADDGRPWIDELDRYQVRVKNCPQNIRRKM